MNRGDYITISNNVFYSNTWWSSAAVSAVVLDASEHIDESKAIKMVLTKNTVYDNINKIPYYNPKYAWNYSLIGGLECGSYPACEQSQIDGCPWQCRYGKSTQNYIIDGMGVYVTRNNGSYLFGKFELSYNTFIPNSYPKVVLH